ncbi:MAG TPA: hypothetical protein DIT09_12565 [Glutamicibacter sp.]|uniref:tyrosine-type recombinase/integrase n=1 Tax=Glutamicibacter arilaitensis TaxID=256701 RepID=UPI000EECC891|nr:hypothetical protein [Glutamicibacter sp.]
MACITFKRWSDLWLAQRQQVLRPGTYVSDRSAVKRWIIPTIGHICLDVLTPADVRRVASAQVKEGLALSTMQRSYAVLGKILADAHAEGYQVSLRARETVCVGIGSSSRQALSRDDVTRILAVTSSRTDTSRWGAAFSAGLRPAEALGLTWEMVDLNAATMTLAWQLKPLPYLEHRNPASGFRVPLGFESRHLVGAYHLVRPKTRAGLRVIPMVPWLTDALSSWKASQPVSAYDLVWPRDDGGPRSAEYDRAQWYKIVDEAGVTVTLSNGESRRPLLYEARHTAATLLLSNDIDDTTIRAILGHSSMLSTQAYLHADHTRTQVALAASATSLGLRGSLEVEI